MLPSDLAFIRYCNVVYQEKHVHLSSRIFYVGCSLHADAPKRARSETRPKEGSKAAQLTPRYYRDYEHFKLLPARRSHLLPQINLHFKHFSVIGNQEHVCALHLQFLRSICSHDLNAIEPC